MVGAHAARANPIGPGRELRAQVAAQLKLELPKLPGGLPMLRTAIRGARQVHTARVYSRMYPLRLGPVPSVVADSQAR